MFTMNGGRDQCTYIVKFTITQHTTALWTGAIINHPEISQVGVYDFVDVSCLVWCVCVADFGILALSLGVDETIQPAWRVDSSVDKRAFQKQKKLGQAPCQWSKEQEKQKLFLKAVPYRTVEICSLLPFFLPHDPFIAEIRWCTLCHWCGCVPLWNISTRRPAVEGWHINICYLVGG